MMRMLAAGKLFIRTGAKLEFPTNLRNKAAPLPPGGQLESSELHFDLAAPRKEIGLGGKQIRDRVC